MAVAVGRAGAMGILHRFNAIDEQVHEFSRAGAAMTGASPADRRRDRRDG